MGYKTVKWQEGEELTSRKLNEMGDNSEFFAHRKVDGKVRNISPNTHQPRENIPLIGDNLVVLADMVEVQPGDKFPTKLKTNTKRDSFTKRINFPAGFFNATFQPIVVASLGIGTGAIAKATLVIREVTYGGFSATILEHSTEHFTESMPFFINYIAMGIKGSPSG